jgi:DeoR/GlpR family transcriptional regulator of sugar metabolism
MLAEVPNVTYLTNLVPVMDLFSTADPSRASMVGLGGIFRPLTLSFVGPCTIDAIKSYVADRTFFSVKGVTPDGHLTEPHPLEAEVKRVMIRRADSPVLLMDGRKFERRGASVIAHISEVSLVMTADARPSYVEAVKRLGVAVESV